MIRATVVLALLVALGGCASQQMPGRAPTDTRFGAPVVTSPRDIRPFSTDPCAGPLTSPAWESLGFVRGGRVEAAATGERLCDRRGPNGERALSFIIVPDRDVLVDTYRVRQFAQFRPATIGGLPATVEQSSPGSLSCSVTVGTAENQGFIVNYSEYERGANGQADDPCGRAQAVAERIVGALPSLAGN